MLITPWGPKSRDTSWTWIGWDTNWEQIKYHKSAHAEFSVLAAVWLTSEYWMSLGRECFIQLTPRCILHCSTLAARRRILGKTLFIAHIHSFHKDPIPVNQFNQSIQTCWKPQWKPKPYIHYSRVTHASIPTDHSIKQ